MLCRACRPNPTGQVPAAVGTRSSHTTTCRSSGQAANTGANAASRGADVTKTATPASCKICATCVAFSSGFTGTNTPPAAGAAKLATTASTRFSKYTATRAPRASPKASRLAAQRSTWENKSAYARCCPPTVKAARAGQQAAARAGNSCSKTGGTPPLKSGVWGMERMLSHSPSNRALVAEHTLQSLESANFSTLLHTP